MKFQIPRQIFEKYSNTKFHKNPYSGSQVVPCGQTDRRKGGRTDMLKLGVVLPNFSEAPNKTRRQKLFVFLLLSQKLTCILKVPCVREKTRNAKRTSHYYNSSCSITLHGIINRMCRSGIASQFTPALSRSSGRWFDLSWCQWIFH